MNKPKILIIGAGPCGLGAAWRLTELGVSDFHVYEKEDHVGGLASSYVDNNGFTWDVGGHVLHSHYPYFDGMFASVMNHEYFTHERESWIWLYNRFIPYPFQNNIHRLPKTVLSECLTGLKELSTKKFSTKIIHNFRDWMLASFGKGISHHFLYPYNSKVWAYPSEKMNYSWVGDRVAMVDLARIEENVRLKRDDVAWGPNAVFQFPKHGGTGDIWKRVASRFTKHISFNKNVKRIDSHKRIVYFSDDTKDSYDELLTTMPLDKLVGSIDNNIVPKHTSLHHSKVSIVGIGIQDDPPEQLRHKCWMYFPDITAPFFRATVFSNYSKYNAPIGTWSLMTETASSRYRPLPMGDIAKLAVNGAIATKLISKRSKIVGTWVFEADYGYPTPTLERDDYLHYVLPLLAKHHIYSRGRFGAWKYEVSNQDHTFMQGVEFVNHLILGDDETTVYNLNLISNHSI